MGGIDYAKPEPDPEVTTFYWSPFGWYDCSYFSNSTKDDLWWSLLWAEIRKTFIEFLTVLAPQSLEPNPLPILARAVNRLKLGRVIFQPRWSANRWKSKT